MCVSIPRARTIHNAPIAVPEPGCHLHSGIATLLLDVCADFGTIIRESEQRGII
jgi:hypothetical protein